MWEGEASVVRRGRVDGVDGLSWAALGHLLDPQGDSEWADGHTALGFGDSQAWR